MGCGRLGARRNILVLASLVAAVVVGIAADPGIAGNDSGNRRRRQDAWVQLLDNHDRLLEEPFGGLPDQ